ncbi:hypothetical protein [Variovorax sp. WS11]|nr:hypothetical protein [Variovorax sp. WS11]
MGRGSESDVPARGLLAQVMLDAGRPVLVVPYDEEFKDVAENA